MLRMHLTHLMTCCHWAFLRLNGFQVYFLFLFLLLRLSATGKSTLCLHWNYTWPRAISNAKCKIYVCLPVSSRPAWDMLVDMLFILFALVQNSFYIPRRCTFAKDNCEIANGCLQLKHLFVTSWKERNPWRFEHLELLYIFVFNILFKLKMSHVSSVRSSPPNGALFILMKAAHALETS